MRERKIYWFAAIGIGALIGLHAFAHTASRATETELARLYQQVIQLSQAGKYAEAVPIATKLLELCERTLGPEDPRTATILGRLATLYTEMGDYAQAERAYQRALKIHENALGPAHSETATSLHNLARLYEATGDYAKAERFYQRALKIYEKALGPAHPNTSTSLNNLAALYDAMGDHAKAEPLYQRALKIREKALGPAHPKTASTVSNLAALYDTMGDYAKAEPLYQRALKIREKALGPEHPDTATSLNNLATFYHTMGNYAKAEPLFQRALKIYEKALGPEHPKTAKSLNNLAGFYKERGNYAKAEPLYQHALKIREKALGPEHPDTARSLDNLAGLYKEMGNYAKAEPLYQRALKIREKALGPEHPDTSTSLNNLALFYCYKGDYAKAEPLFQRALKISEKAFGPEHPDTAISLTNLALLNVAKGDPTEALRLARLAQQADEKTLSNILSFTSEQQRLAFQKTTRPYNLPGVLGNAPELAEIVLRQKGVVLDSLLEDRLVAEASQDPKQHQIVDELRGVKQRLMQLLLEAPKDLSEKALRKSDAEKKGLSQKVEGLEAGLARRVAGLGRARHALSVTVAQVQAALGRDEALVELLRYDHLLGKNKFERRYGAIVIAPSGEPKWVPLGAASEIEKGIQLYQKSARGKTDSTTLSNVLHALHVGVWEPIEKALPAGTKTIIVSPDAQLSFVSFATLIGHDDKFVAEKYSIRYVASGRDLLRETKSSASEQMTVYANADFGSKGTSPAASERGATVALRSIEMRELQSISLPALPGTATEAAALEKRAGKSTKLFLGPNATEAELRKVNSPRVLHLATHGFFLPEMDLATRKTGPLEREQDMPKGKLVNPMHRSGLALSGALTTLQAWSRGEVPPTENDGIVTAEEVGGLKLEGTELVVLSACETGSGEARAGEGVMGLRRGFVQAGTKNLLMTLWPISDETTVKIMLDFYDAADKTNAPQALANVQRDWLVKLRNDHGLLPAVQLAGPFIMNSQGKP